MQNVKLAAMAFVIMVVAAGCGAMPEATPAPTTAPATSAASGGDATPGTPESSALTFGGLADRVGAAWPSVRSYRITFTGPAPISPAGVGTPVARLLATPGATPMPRPGGMYTTVRDVVLPDRQRQTVTGLGADDHEAIAIGDALYVRGPVVAQIAPGTATEDWIQLDAASLPAGAQLLHLLGGLPELPGAPLATLPDRLRTQEVRELETVELDGRECHVYAAADTIPATGMRVDYTIALDESDIPCFIETGAGGVAQGRDEYTLINEELDIQPPIAASTVTIPPALATPIAHD